MTFSPSCRERYRAALRQTLHRRLLQRDKTQKILTAARKITLTEQLYCRECPTATDFRRFIDPLLGAVLLIAVRKGYFPRTEYVGNGTVFLPRRKVTALICLLLAESPGGTAKAVLSDKFLTVSVTGSTRRDPTVSALAEKLGGSAFFLRRNGLFAVHIPVSRTKLHGQSVPEEWDYFRDPFSLPNLILSAIPSRPSAVRPT